MRKVLWGATAAVGLSAVAACGGSPYTTATLTTTSSSTATQTTTVVAIPAPAPAPRTVRWVDLQAGDCLADPPPSDPAVVMVSVVDCAGPHQAETFLRAPIPVNAALTGVGNQQCDAGLARYTGGGPYTLSYLIDSEQDRTSNNPYPSTVICLLQGTDGQPMTGSARR
ncbi:septum formation family protein [Mycobacterium sp. NBC_00419]|uniref:hypothetical protein n=1 Tax=Mycobacterium sp. NBC_00419 TaxID=2975989 RepID=UPI002E21612B